MLFIGGFSSTESTEVYSEQARSDGTSVTGKVAVQRQGLQRCSIQPSGFKIS